MLPERRSEFERIARIVAGLPRGEGVVVGPGDDAAVLRLREGRDLVATTDTLVEGRHFRRDLLSPEEAGTRLAAANLSDLAAMAAEPRWALVALVIPPAWLADEAERLERAFASVLRTEGAAVVGGNLSSGDGRLVANVTLLGEVDRGAAWTRAGARVGDAIAVTGHPGSAAAFLALALWGNPASRERVPPALAARYLSPPSRVAFARALASAGGVRAAVDVSDGPRRPRPAVLGEWRGARLEEAALPADEPLRAAARALSAVADQAPAARRRGGTAHASETGPGDAELLAVGASGTEQRIGTRRNVHATHPW